MNKIARCACGALSLEIDGISTFSAICHCEPCQRRTGSVLSVSSYYKKADVKISGPSTVFIREGQQGRKLRNHFCPTCGTTVFWESDFMPDDYGVAVGTLFDPKFPCPDRSVYEESKHEWINVRHVTTHLPRGRPGT